jgi:hypothetical protein
MYASSAHQLKIQFPFSIKWQEIALFIAQNKDTLDSMQIMEMNNRLKSALDSIVSFDNGMQNVGKSSQVSAFLNGYRSHLPNTTVELL